MTLRSFGMKPSERSMQAAVEFNERNKLCPHCGGAGFTVGTTIGYGGPDEHGEPIPIPEPCQEQCQWCDEFAYTFAAALDAARAETAERSGKLVRALREVIEASQKPDVGPDERMDWSRYLDARTALDAAEKEFAEGLDTGRERTYND